MELIMEFVKILDYPTKCESGFKNFKMVRLSVSQPSVPSLLALFCRDLQKRNLIFASTPPLNINEKENAVSTIPNVIYAGFDPTADSFHVGNLLIISNLIRASLFGCRSIALIGGASAQIGDPSGRSTDRVSLQIDTVNENAKNLLKQLVEISENAKDMHGRNFSLSIVNNMEWYDKMSALDFLQIGRKFRVGDMLRVGPIKSRMVPGKGISFTEFTYPIFQSYDWYVLAKNYDCYFQLGGSDQLGNLESGHDFIQKQLNALSFGVCLPLVTDTKGQKLGKSTLSPMVIEGEENVISAENSSSLGGGLGGVWLDGQRTSPFSLYQYFRQLPDELAETLLLYYSLRPVEHVEEILAEHRANRSKWLAQSQLADEMVELVHGSSGLELARSCSRILFGGKLKELENLSGDTICSLFGDASTFSIAANSIHTFGELADRTRSDKKRGAAIMREGSFYVNGQKFVEPEAVFRMDEFLIRGEFFVVSWGKRNYKLVRWI